MQLVSSLLFGVSASLDALLVGVSYGLRGIHFKALQNLFISMITLLGTCLSVSLGSFLTPLLPSAMGSCIGSFILMLLGIYYISKWSLSSLKDRAPNHLPKPERSAPAQTAQNPPRLYVTEIFLLSLTLSANNLGIGLSASMAGLGLAPAATATFVCSVLFLYIGNCLGRSRLLQMIGSLADPISGFLLIGLGIIQLFL